MENMESYLRKFLGLVMMACVVALLWQPQEAYSAYDGSKPTGSTPIASYPPIIRENLRALKEDGIVNAGTLASMTVAEILSQSATTLQAYASTTNTEMFTPAGARLDFGTATGVVTVQILTSAVGTSTQTFNAAGFTHNFSLRIATTTEILGDIIKYHWFENASSSLWNLGIATSTRGIMVLTASGPVGASWTASISYKKVTW